MRELRDIPAGNAQTTSAAIKTTSNNNLWKSPVPYLFGSLAMVLLLITVALILLLCSYRQRRRFPPGEDDDHHDPGEKPAKAVNDVVELPKVVVVMAGDDKPTYLATPSVVLVTATSASSDDHICTCANHDTNQAI